MKLSIFYILFITTLFACKKNSVCDKVTTQATASETTSLKNTLTSMGVSFDADERGFFYKIITPGSSEKPDVCSTVKVNYAGTLINGTPFDDGAGVSFPLANLIVGWKEGIPLIGKGGKIILYLPPSLAYGSASQSGIPANSNLIFTIDLISF
jgi:FKBP-type peptidyl-prolyl cis-trans isomerase